MRGTVVGYDSVSHTGAISGHDGKRYNFVTMDWRAQSSPRPGTEVDFSPEGNDARQIFPVSGSAMPRRPFTWGWFLFSLEGRISRSEYWLRFVLPAVVVSIVLAFIDAAIGALDPTTGFGLLSGLFTLVLIWPSIAVGGKRAHDRDKSAWWLLINLIPIVGALWWLIEFGFLRGTIGDNRYGPDPLEGRG